VSKSEAAASQSYERVIEGRRVSVSHDEDKMVVLVEVEGVHFGLLGLTNLGPLESLGPLDDDDAVYASFGLGQYSLRISVELGEQRWSPERWAVDMRTEIAAMQRDDEYLEVAEVRPVPTELERLSDRVVARFSLRDQPAVLRQNVYLGVQDVLFTCHMAVHEAVPGAAENLDVLASSNLVVEIVDLSN